MREDGKVVRADTTDMLKSEENLSFLLIQHARETWDSIHCTTRGTLGEVKPTFRFFKSLITSRIILFF